MDGAGDILAYEKSIPQMFVTNVFNFASEGKCYRYSSVNAPLTVWGPWHTEKHRSEGTLLDVQQSMTDMIKPETVMDIFRFFTLYATDKKHRKYKVICMMPTSRRSAATSSLKVPMPSFSASSRVKRSRA